ncbi:MAG TPA: Rrf2 family transcriptional regulator [Myxococcaceae bacterium]|jgi:Rrf2 family protein|nr:Rrf2 family transcriptional regulator [Myxococcaceae bacterium]
MQHHALQISRKIEYGLRAMVCLAAQPAGTVVPFREIARRMDVPQDFLAKILKTLVARGLVASTRGAHGGYRLTKPPREITFLDVIEAVEGPFVVSLCGGGAHESCRMTRACTMYGVWRRGQERMLEVYRSATLDQLAMGELKPAALPVVAAAHA